MMPPTSIDGTDITGATIDGQDVQEITVDGQTVFSAGWFVGFESGNINEFTVDKGSFSVQSSTVYEGSFALEATAGSRSPEFAGAHSSNYTISRGDSIEGYIYLPGTVQNIRVDLRADPGDGYEFLHDSRSSVERIRRYDGGERVIEDNYNGVTRTDEWLRLEIDYNNPIIDFRLFDSNNTKLLDESLNDSTYGDCRLQFHNFYGGEVWDSFKLV